MTVNPPRVKIDDQGEISWASKEFGLVDFVAIASMVQTQAYQIELDYIEAQPEAQPEEKSEKPGKPVKEGKLRKPAKVPKKK